jgi:hypothetical protein
MVTASPGRSTYVALLRHAGHEVERGVGALELSQEGDEGAAYERVALAGSAERLLQRVQSHAHIWCIVRAVRHVCVCATAR